MGIPGAGARPEALALGEPLLHAGAVEVGEAAPRPGLGDSFDVSARRLAVTFGAARRGHRVDECIEVLRELRLEVSGDPTVGGRDDPEALALDFPEAVGEPLSGVDLLAAFGIGADGPPVGVLPTSPVSRGGDSDPVADALATVRLSAAGPFGDGRVALGADGRPGGERLGPFVSVDGAHRTSYCCGILTEIRQRFEEI